MASWWSNREVEMAPGRWCREPPPYAFPKPALPTRSPPFDEKPLLSVAMARQHASPDNMLIVTYVNKNRLDFALTWVRHLLAVNQPHFLVGALDAEALRGLEEHGVPCYLIDYSKLASTDTGWGTHAFRMLGLYKVQMVLDLARTGVDTLTVDADAFLVRDPLPYFRMLPQADVLMSSDQLSATRGYGDEGLEDEGAYGAAFNIGYIFIRASAVEFVQEWRDKCANGAMLANARTLEVGAIDINDAGAAMLLVNSAEAEKLKDSWAEIKDLQDMPKEFAEMLDLELQEDTAEEHIHIQLVGEHLSL